MSCIKLYQNGNEFGGSFGIEIKKSKFMKFTAHLVFLLISNITFSQVGIGTNTPAPSAQLDVTSTNKGALLPRMTMAQRNSIATPALGLLIYQIDNTPGFYYFDGVIWIGFCNTSSVSSATLDNKSLLYTIDGF